MELDLRPGRPLSKGCEDLYQPFTETALSTRSMFFSLIDGLTDHFNGNLDWLLSLPASRNTIGSLLFFYCTSVAFVEQHASLLKDITHIRACNETHKDLLLQAISRAGLTITVQADPEKRFRLPRFAFALLHLLRALYVLLAARLTRPHTTPATDKALILAETFVDLRSPEPDAYFCGIETLLPPSVQDRFYYVPTFYAIPFKKLCATLRALRQTSSRILFREDVLGLGDHIAAFGHYFRLRTLRVPTTLFGTYDLTPAIQSELGSITNFGAALSGMLHYRFLRALKAQGYSLEHAVDWFEDQEVNKGWHKGLHDFHPAALSTGYMGYAHLRFELHPYPTEGEYRAGVLPGRLVVPGKGYTKNTAQFLRSITPATGPAFRFRHIASACISSRPPDAPILLTLPLWTREAAAMLRETMKALHNRADLQILVKFHPRSRRDTIMTALGSPLPDSFSVTEETMADALCQCRLMLSGGSSACLEALAVGVPLIVLAFTGILSDHPVPEDIPKQMWRECFQTHALPDLIDEISGSQIDTAAFTRYMQENFFYPVTENTVAEFLQPKRSGEL